VTPGRALAALALIVGLAHAPFLASSLEDIDSVNFALGVRDFDVADHRPHPPGYPVYIAAGKVLAALTAPLSAGSPRSAIEARALSLGSLLAAMGVGFLLYRVYAVSRPPAGRSTSIDGVALGTTVVASACPLSWTLAVRPMSDLPGLAALVAAQACFVTAWRRQTPGADGDRRLRPEDRLASGRAIVLGALLAGVAVGVRTQSLWLTAPLLALVLLDRVGRGAAGALAGAAMTFTIGALAWAVPLVVASGGPGPYLAALGSQAGEDFAAGEMLYTNPAPRLIAAALMHTLVDPWDSVALAALVLILAAAGGGGLLWRDRRTCAAAAAMGLPYLAFHLLFQDTSFIRYALPLVPLVSFLAIQGLSLLSLSSGRVVAGGSLAIATWSVVLAAPVVAEYAATPAPAVRAVEAMNAAAIAARPDAVAMHQTFVRPLEAEEVRVGPQLPSPPRREWLELARFWRATPDGTVWFLADPRRSDLALLDPRSRRDRTELRWAPVAHRMFGDVRPAAVDWIRLSPPRWFAGEGWSLTPETAGMARLVGRGPHLGPISAWVRRDAGPARILVGGRNLAGAADPWSRVSIAIDGQVLDEWDVAPGFFLRTIDVPAGGLAGEGPLAELDIRAAPVSGDALIPTAIEQFDLQAPDALMWGFDEGWHEAEYSPALGVWHWSSERAVLRLVGATTSVRVSLDIESPLRYFDGPSRVRAMAGDVEFAASSVGAGQSWSFDVPIDALRAAGGRIVIETSQTFVPAERGEGPDLRRLGLRVFRVRVDSAG
jgi:hypothetical protein